MARIIIPLLIFLTNSFGVFCQKHDVGIWIGASNYFGDLNTNYSFKYIRPAGGFIARQNMNPHWATKLTLSGGRILFHDDASEYPFQMARNLGFKSYILELSGHIEFNFFRFISGDDEAIFTPYVLSGLSVFYFNPTSSIDGGSNVRLNHLGTEGQGFNQKRYSLIQLAIPYGVGIKYNFNGFWNWSIEVANRKAFTDYLDDISIIYVDKNDLRVHNGPESAIMSDLSYQNQDGNQIGDTVGKQRGNSQDNDAYLFISISLTYTIRSFKCAPIPR